MHELYTTFCLNLVVFIIFSHQNDQCFTEMLTGGEQKLCQLMLTFQQQQEEEKKKTMKERIAGEYAVLLELCLSS